MVYPCEACDLECSFKEWRKEHPRDPDAKPEDILKSGRLTAFAKRNPICPGDDEKYNEIMGQCEERSAFDEKLEVCLNCKNRKKILSFKDVIEAPEDCPRKDPMKDLAGKLTVLSQPLSLITETLKTVSLARETLLEQMTSISSSANKALENIAKHSLPNYDYKWPTLSERAIVYPELLSPLSRATAEVNTQLLKRINELERELEKAYQEIERLRRIIAEYEYRSEEEPDYIH